MNAIDFSDLETDLSESTVSSPSKSVVEAKCLACCGSGTRTYGYVNIRSYPCTQCKGTGKVSESRLKRIAGAKQARQTRSNNLLANIAKWKAEHPNEAKWLVNQAPTFDFAASLLDALTTYGRLTDGQLAAVQRTLAKIEARNAERAIEAQANQVDVTSGANLVRAALEKAAAAKLRKPSMRAGELHLSLAPATGKNPGCVYVKAGEDYVGKIEPNGMFVPVRACTAEHKALVVEVMTNPLDAAIKYGRMTGNCSCCGRRLDNAKSIELGIGPICLSKYFGG